MPERSGRFDEIGLDMFYSFNVGPIHFVSINTEFYYFLEVIFIFIQLLHLGRERMYFQLGLHFKKT